MKDIHKKPESNLEKEVRHGQVPALAYLLLFLFVLEALSVIVINLSGAYGIEPVELMSGEMAIVLAAAALILGSVWYMTIKGKKIISTIIYVFLVIALVFDGPNWFGRGIFSGISEVLTFVDFLLLLGALYIVKFPLRQWFVR